MNRQLKQAQALMSNHRFSCWVMSTSIPIRASLRCNRWPKALRNKRRGPAQCTIGLNCRPLGPKWQRSPIRSKSNFRTQKLAKLRGAKATKESVAARMGKFRYVHLATHGFFAAPTVKSVFATSASPCAGR